jgi:hypothetical protein
MGLDMYLDKELYISEFNKQDADKIGKIYDLLGVKDCSENYKHLSIKLPAIYWRKSNQIHSWFVSNVQNGEDNCAPHDVDIDDLRKLLDLVKKQLKNKSEIILKPTSGFFFGSTDIDEWYWKDLERTKKELEREIQFILEQNKLERNWNYEYRSSW